MRIGWSVLFLTVFLAGCFGGGGKLGDDEMQQRSEAAIDAFRTAIGSGGDLSRIEVSGTMAVEHDVNGFPARVNLEPAFDVAFGPEADLLLVGHLGPLQFTTYCSPGTLVVITQGGEPYDVPDTSVEARNPQGVCTGGGVEPLLLRYFEFELIDPSIITGDLRVEELEPIGFADEGHIVATYEVAGPQGTTEMVLRIDGGRIVRIIAENDDSTLVMDMTYGDRGALAVPEAQHRLPAWLSGASDKDGGMWTWEGRSVEGGAFDEYAVMVVEGGHVPACGSEPDAVVGFDLGDGADQEKDGWTLTFIDDGDGLLGDGDRIFVRQPGGSVQPFENDVVIYDRWAGSVTRAGCAVPGASVGLIGLGIAALAIVARRRP